MRETGEKDEELERLRYAVRTSGADVVADLQKKVVQLTESSKEVSQRYMLLTLVVV